MFGTALVGSVELKSHLSRLCKDSLPCVRIRINQFEGKVEMRLSISVAQFKEKLLQDVSSAVRATEFHSHKLVLVVVADKYRTQLEKVLLKDDVEFINLSKRLSSKLINFSLRERQRDLDEEVSSIAMTCDSSIWLTKLDLLCEPSLNCDPIRLLKWLAKYQLIVAVWPGVIEGSSLVYSVPGREDYRTYPLKELNDIQVIDTCNGVI